MSANQKERVKLESGRTWWVWYDEVDGMYHAHRRITWYSKKQKRYRFYWREKKGKTYAGVLNRCMNYDENLSESYSKGGRKLK